MKPTGCSPGTSAGKPLGEPRAARIDADERGVVRDRAAHALGERDERRFGVRQLRSSLIEPSLQDESARRPRRASARPCAPAPAASSADLCELRRVALVREATGNREALAQAPARNAARARSSRAACRPHAPGRPTTSSRGCHSRDQRARARRSASSLAARRSWSADCALRVIVLPTATPMRRVPKSNASTVAGGRRRGHASRVPDVLGQAREVDAEQLHRRGQPLLRAAGRTSRRRRLRP